MQKLFGILALGLVPGFGFAHGDAPHKAKRERKTISTEEKAFYFGCLIPGHFEAGMVGKLTVN